MSFVYFSWFYLEEFIDPDGVDDGCMVIDVKELITIQFDSSWVLNRTYTPGINNRYHQSDIYCDVMVVVALKESHTFIKLFKNP